MSVRSWSKQALILNLKLRHGKVSTNIPVILVVVCAILAPAIVIAVLGAASIKALGRNPSAAPKIYTGVILMLIFTEAASLAALLVVFQIFGSK